MMEYWNVDFENKVFNAILLANPVSIFHACRTFIALEGLSIFFASFYFPA